MKQIKLKLCGAIMFGFGIVGLQAQQTLTTSGGNGTGNGGSVSYTIGQTVYSTNTGNGSSVAHGVQQPYEISIVSDLAKNPDPALTCSVFPNPSTNYLILKVEDAVNKQYSASLYDIKGSLLVTQKITTNETVIAMGNYVPATYFLKITQKQGSATIQVIKTFKIIKTQ
jgi:Secretion system C-terminal sorting domain